jgi:hypothetical protein
MTLNLVYCLGGVKTESWITTNKTIILKRAKYQKGVRNMDQGFGTGGWFQAFCVQACR